MLWELKSAAISKTKVWNLACLNAFFKTNMRHLFILQYKTLPLGWNIKLNHLSMLQTAAKKQSTTCYTSQVQTCNFPQSNLQIYENLLIIITKLWNYKSVSQSTFVTHQTSWSIKIYYKSNNQNTVCYTSQFANLQLLLVTFTDL